MSESVLAEGRSIRVQQMISEAQAEGDEGGDDSAASAPAPDLQTGAPPTGEGSEAGSAVVDEAAAAQTPEQKAAAEAAAATKTKQQILADKLEETRARNAARRAAQEAKELAARAKTDAEKVAEERAKYEGLKNGTFLDTIKALGLDPRKAFEDMKDEAVRAGTPEAKIAAMQARFDAEIKAAVEPLKKQLDEERAARERSQAREHASAFASAFEKTINDAAYQELRVEHDDGEIMRFASVLVEDPARTMREAKRLGVQLTRDDGRFTMKEILNVLARTQEEHDKGRQQRRSRFQASTQAPPNPQAAQAAPNRTVNGTERRTAASTLGNDSAASRATDASGRRRESRHERVQRLIEDG